MRTLSANGELPLIVSPASTAVVPTEAQEHNALWDWVKLEQSLPTDLGHALATMYDVRSEGQGRATRGKRSGVPDWCLDWPYHPPRCIRWFHGLRIELKRRNATKRDVRPDQRKMLALLAQRGYAACVCRGWEEARATVEAYVAGRPIVGVAWWVF